MLRGENQITEELPANSRLILENKYARVAMLKEQKAIICQALESFIPKEKFINVFEEIGDYIKLNSNSVKKIIFDKRNLRVFDQQAMTWYHIVFKKEMLAFGLKTWRKLLPQEDSFKISVNIGKNKIKTEYPDFDFASFDIQYVDSFEEALAS